MLISITTPDRKNVLRPADTIAQTVPSICTGESGRPADMTLSNPATSRVTRNNADYPAGKLASKSAPEF
jgi:hypothetical protein